MQSGNNQRMGNNRKYQNFRVEDLRHKLNRMREQRALEGGGTDPPPYPGYNYLRDPTREYESNYHHRPNYRGRGQHYHRGGKPHHSEHDTHGYSKDSAAFKKEFNQGRTVNIKVEVETDTGNRTCSVELLNRGAPAGRRARGGFRGRFNHNHNIVAGYESNQQYSDGGRGRRGRGGGRGRGFYRGRFRGRNNRGGFGTRRGTGARNPADDNANQTQEEEYWDDDEGRDNTTEHDKAVDDEYCEDNRTEYDKAVDDEYCEDNRTEHDKAVDDEYCEDNRTEHDKAVDDEYCEEHGDYEQYQEEESDLPTGDDVLNETSEDAAPPLDESCSPQINTNEDAAKSIVGDSKETNKVSKSDDLAIDEINKSIDSIKLNEDAPKSDGKDSKTSDKPVVVKVEKKVAFTVK